MTRASWVGPLASISALAALAACRVEVGAPERAARAAEGGAPSGKITIYTSMYRPVIDALGPVLAAEVPGVEVEWLQSGSEKIATRLDAELSAGEPRADLVMTSDPFYYERLKHEGHLLPYASLRALALPRELLDTDGTYVAARLSAMVIAYDTRRLAAEAAPRSFDALFSPAWKGKVTTPDPLGSGTAFTTLAFLADALGPEIIDRMKAAETIASGGSPAVVTRLEGGEHQVAYALLENVLIARRAGSPVGFLVPEEGAVLVPGPIAILKKTRNPAAAKAIYDAILSPEGQAKIIAGDMHSPFEGLPPPTGAPSLAELQAGRLRWSPALRARVVAGADALRRRFAAVMGAAP